MHAWCRGCNIVYLYVCVCCTSLLVYICVSTHVHRERDTLYIETVQNCFFNFVLYVSMLPMLILRFLTLCKLVWSAFPIHNTNTIGIFWPDQILRIAFWHIPRQNILIATQHECDSSPTHNIHVGMSAHDLMVFITTTADSS